MNLKKLRDEILKKNALIQEELSDLSPFFKKYSCILMVDDEEMINFFNKKTIESLQISNKIKHVSSGEKGLRFLKKVKLKHFPLLILIDASIHITDGFDFLELAIFCNFITDDVTIAFLTSDNYKNTESVKTKGIKDYIFIQKPLNRDNMKVFFN